MSSGSLPPAPKLLRSRIQQQPPPPIGEPRSIGLPKSSVSSSVSSTQHQAVKGESSQVRTSLTGTSQERLKLTPRLEQPPVQQITMVSKGSEALMKQKDSDDETRRSDNVNTIGRDMPVNQAIREAVIQKHQSNLGQRRSVSELLGASLKQRFAALNYVGTGIQSTRAWSDSNVRALPVLDVALYQNLSEVGKRGVLSVAINALTTEVSPYSVGHIFVAAWGLYSCKNHHQFAFTEPVWVGNKVDPETLDKNILVNKTVGKITVPNENTDIAPNENELHWRRTATYYCAAMLRLVTKEGDNIVRAWEAIQRQYRNFYREKPAFTFNVDQECANKIREIIQGKRILRETVGVFLIAFKNCGVSDQGMMRRLFERHMSYTGMHSYNLILFCVSRLKTPIDIFLTLLYSPTTREAINEAAYILENLEFPRTPEA